MDLFQAGSVSGVADEKRNHFQGGETVRHLDIIAMQVRVILMHGKICYQLCNQQSKENPVGTLQHYPDRDELTFPAFADAPSAHDIDSGGFVASETVYMVSTRHDAVILSLC